MNTNANRDEVAYQLTMLQRKKDAKTRMKQTAKLMNGEFRTAVADEIVGVSKKLKKNAKS